MEKFSSPKKFLENHVKKFEEFLIKICKGNLDIVKDPSLKKEISMINNFEEELRKFDLKVIENFNKVSKAEDFINYLRIDNDGKNQCYINGSSDKKFKLGITVKFAAFLLVNYYSAKLKLYSEWDLDKSVICVSLYDSDILLNLNGDDFEKYISSLEEDEKVTNISFSVII